MTSGSAIIGWILVPLFAAVALYLFWYARRRKQMLAAFAGKHHFNIREERLASLQAALDRSFALQSAGLVRRFGTLATAVEAGPIWLFRAIELLDLNPHAESYNSHYHRIVALFDITDSYDAFFVIDKSRRVRTMLPGAAMPDAALKQVVQQALQACNGRHRLSLTLARGKALMYFEPLLHGGESGQDIDCLYCLAKRLSQHLQ